MKKQSFVITLILIVITFNLLLTGCGWLYTVRDAGPLTSREYDFTDFNVLDIGSAFKVEIDYGDEYRVQITTNENYFKDIITTRYGNTLKIRVKPIWGIGIISPTLEAKIIMPELVKLTLSGAAEGTVRGFKSMNDSVVRVSGASKLDLDMETGRFISELSGASKMTAALINTDADISLSGASELTLTMTTGNFLYKSSGASDTSGIVNAVKTSLHLSGASSIDITGSGGDIDLSGSGASVFKLKQYNIENVIIDLSGASRAYMVISGMIIGELSGASELIYEGNPVLGDKLDISGGSKFEFR